MVKFDRLEKAQARMIMRIPHAFDAMPVAIGHFHCQFGRVRQRRKQTHFKPGGRCVADDAHALAAIDDQFRHAQQQRKSGCITGIGIRPGRIARFGQARCVRVVMAFAMHRQIHHPLHPGRTGIDLVEFGIQTWVIRYGLLPCSYHDITRSVTGLWPARSMFLDQGIKLVGVFRRISSHKPLVPKPQLALAIEQ